MTITAFTSPAALVAAFGERELVMLTDVGATRTGLVDTAVAQQACDRANAEVTAKVGSRYPMPLASVPELLRHIAADLAHYYLYQSEVPDWVAARYKQAEADLDAIRDGKLQLGADVSGAPVTSTPTDLPDFDGGSKVWGREVAW